MSDVPFADRYTAQVMQENHDSAIESAQAVVPLVLAAVPDVHSVVDVGCGLGTWLAEFKRQGVDHILGIDGPWTPRDRLAIPESDFAVSDFTYQRDPVRWKDKALLLSMVAIGEPQFDLCVSLEVAEHLPPECAESFVEFLTGFAPVILFSAAFPGQGGHYHVNERPQAYWKDLFFERGYVLGDVPGLHTADANFWYLNAYLLVKQS